MSNQYSFFRNCIWQDAVVDDNKDIQDILLLADRLLSTDKVQMELSYINMRLCCFSDLEINEFYQSPPKISVIGLQKKRTFAIYDPQLDTIQINEQFFKYVLRNPVDEMKLLLAVTLLHEICHRLVRWKGKNRRTPSDFKGENRVQDCGFFLEHKLFPTDSKYGLTLVVTKKRKRWFHDYNFDTHYLTVTRENQTMKVTNVSEIVERGDVAHLELAPISPEESGNLMLIGRGLDEETTKTDDDNVIILDGVRLPLEPLSWWENLTLMEIERNCPYADNK